MSFEVEQKFRTASHTAVAARLAALGADPGPRVTHEDAYLNHPGRDFATTHEAFRLRRVGDHNALTYKGPKREGPTKTREEVEVPYADGPGAFERMRRLFEALGFRPVAVVRKARTPYRLHYQGLDAEVVLDDADGLGTFVEVEVIAAAEADLAEAQGAVVALAAELGLTEPEPRSYLRMALERAAARSDD